MSFSAEIKDFLSTALAIHKEFRETASSRAKSDYYSALIGSKQVDAAAKKQRFALDAAKAKDTSNYRAQRLKQIDGDNESKADLRKARIDKINKPAVDKGGITLVPDDDAEGAAAGRVNDAFGTSSRSPAAPAPRRALPVEAVPASSATGASSASLDDEDETDTDTEDRDDE